MSRLTNLTLLLLVCLFFGLASCSGGAPTTDPSLVFTQIWQTVEVAQAQTALAASPTPSITNTPAVSTTLEATNTPLITSTSLPGVPSATPFSISTSTPAGTQSTACDNAIGVADVTYPDGVEVPAGESFNKIWRVKNLGPCTWNQNYRLIFGWGGAGTNWNTAPSSHFTETVLPGETIDISITLKAPTAAGNYAAAFRLQNDKGFNFGPAQTVVIVVK